MHKLRKAEHQPRNSLMQVESFDQITKHDIHVPVLALRALHSRENSQFNHHSDPRVLHWGLSQSTRTSTHCHVSNTHHCYIGRAPRPSFREKSPGTTRYDGLSMSKMKATTPFGFLVNPSSQLLPPREKSSGEDSPNGHIIQVSTVYKL